jgi:toxin ParE1/3/4
MGDAGRMIRFHPEALAELRDSVDFYRSRAGDGWAEIFKRRIEETLQAVARDPGRFPPVRGVQGVQRARVKQFPFSLLYIERPNLIWVVAVAHGSRRPGYWMERFS